MATPATWRRSQGLKNTPGTPHEACFPCANPADRRNIVAVQRPRAEQIVMSRLDRTDLRLLAVLQGEGRITNAALAERVSLSASACLRRLQRLDADGIVTGYAAQIDPQSVGLGLQ